MNEISDMERIFWELLFSQLTLVEVVDEQTNGTVQSIRTTRKATGRTSQASQIVSEFCVVAFHGVSVGFAFRNRIPTPVIPQRGIHIESIAVIPRGLGSMVNDGLHKFL